MRKHILIVGAGGNIGSHLTTHVARMEGIGRITLVDPDRYEAKNVGSQDITRADVGRRKAFVQRARVRRIAQPGVDVVAIAEPIEQLPLGRLQADVMVACLDSRAARQHVNQAAWWLGVPWIDAGVEPAALLARVNVYVPALDTACLECAWSDADYAALEQVYPCQGSTGVVRGRTPAPTNALSCLGALAASLEAVECHKLLRGDTAHAAIGRQLLLDAASLKYYVTAFRRREGCRMHPHRPPEISRLPEGPNAMTLGALIDRASMDGIGRRQGLVLGVAGMRFAREVSCANPACGRTRQLWRFGRSWTNGVARCRACGGLMQARGFDVRERVEMTSMPSRMLRRPLSRLGLRGGDLCTVSGPEGERQYLLGVDLT